MLDAGGAGQPNMQRFCHPRQAGVGGLVAVAHSSIINCRIDSLCHCGGTLLLFSVTRHRPDQVASAEAPSSSDEDFMQEMPLFGRRKPRSTRSTWCMRSEFQERLDFLSACDCIRCQPEEDNFHPEVHAWDWRHAHTTMVRAFSQCSYTVRHGRSRQGARGTVEFNAVFASVPAKIIDICCLQSNVAGFFQWACGADEVSFYRSAPDPAGGAGEAFGTTTVASTGPLRRFIPLRCSATVEHLLWLVDAQILAVAVQGGSNMRSYYDGDATGDAVAFEGCILLFKRESEDLTFSCAVREHANIEKVVDTTPWWKPDYDRIVEGIQWRKKVDDASDPEEEYLKWNRWMRHNRENERLLFIDRPRLTIRISGMQRSADESFLYVAAPSTSQKHQFPRVAGPPGKLMPPRLLKDVKLDNGDELFHKLAPSRRFSDERTEGSAEGRERERERERKREREREKERERERDGERERERERQKDRKRQKETESKTERKKERKRENGKERKK